MKRCLRAWYAPHREAPGGQGATAQLNLLGARMEEFEAICDDIYQLVVLTATALHLLLLLLPTPTLLLAACCTYCPNALFANLSLSFCFKEHTYRHVTQQQLSALPAAAQLPSGTTMAPPSSSSSSSLSTTATTEANTKDTLQAQAQTAKHIRQLLSSFTSSVVPPLSDPATTTSAAATTTATTTTSPQLPSSS